MQARSVRFRKKKKQNRFGMALVFAAVLVIFVVVFYQNNLLQEKKAAYEAREQQLAEQIEAETERTEEIEQYRKYTQTKAYVEEVAKDKLGMVNEGEVIYKPED